MDWLQHSIKWIERRTQMPKIEVEKLVAFTHMQYRFISFVLLRWFAFYLHAIKVLNYFMTIWVKFKRFFFSLHFFVHRRLINHKMTGEMFAIFVCFVFFFFVEAWMCLCLLQTICIIAFEKDDWKMKSKLNSHYLCDSTWLKGKSECN